MALESVVGQEVWVVTWYTDIGDDNVIAYSNGRKAAGAIYKSALKKIKTNEDKLSVLAPRLVSGLEQYKDNLLPSAIIEWWHDELAHRIGLWVDVYNVVVQ